MTINEVQSLLDVSSHPLVVTERSAADVAPVLTKRWSGAALRAATSTALRLASWLLIIPLLLPLVPVAVLMHLTCWLHEHFFAESR